MSNFWFVQKGYWMLIPYDDIKHKTGLRISPIAGIVPQRERRPRVTVDYTFFGLNQETVKLAHQESMQFGKAIERLTTNIVYSDPTLGPCLLYKIDMPDGLYRIPLSTSGLLKLAVMLPLFPGLLTLVAVPLSQRQSAT